LKKEAKLLAKGCGLSGYAAAKFAKVFWFFFSKKNVLSTTIPIG
jgi:hypothetical protein